MGELRKKAVLRTEQVMDRLRIGRVVAPDCLAALLRLRRPAQVCFFLTDEAIIVSQVIVIVIVIESR